MNNLVDWLKRQLDDDERVARALSGATRFVGGSPDFYGVGGPAAAVKLEGITTAEALEGVHRLQMLVRGDKEPDGSVRCWWCGVEPDSLIDITRLESPAPEYRPNWPASTDHQHAEHPPTPAQLEQAGHEALIRVIGS